MMGALNRRALFGALPAIGIAAVPAAVHASQLMPVQSEAEAFAAGVSQISPDLGPLARQAMADGWKPSEIYSVLNGGNGLPAIMFRRAKALTAVKRRITRSL